HNDYGLATANVMAAVRAGINSIHCTINCLGERAGNASLAQVAVVLGDKMKMNLSIDESHLVRTSHLVENFSGKRVAANAPIVGADVFTQTAGIHADGDQKGDLYKSALFPERFSRIHSYALGKMSGKASLRKNLELLELELSEDNQKKVLARIVKLGDSKQTITTEDLPFIIADVLESKNYQHIKLLNCSITSGLDLEATVSIRVDVQNEIHLASGSGNGGFDAFIDAINKVLKLHDYSLPALVDYEVRIPKGGHTSALTECIITWDCANKLRKTRGVHSNQVFSSVMAALRIINIQLQERSQKKTDRA
ncbi:MAG: alpha-isopropylmalate synthase regulatory domain-containing protein, partial [Methylococcales bacterium]